MPAKGSLSFIELHIEKIVLGVAGLITLAVIVYCLIGTNKVEFAGQKIGPGQVDDVIAARAAELKRALDRAEPKTAAVPDYAQQLRRQFESGIFAPDPNGAPPVPRTLRVATLFGSPTPPLKETERPEEKVELVKVLSPTTPVARTGISMVRPRAPVLGTAGREPGEREAPEEQAVERSWVSLAAYFPKEAQKREMTAAGYPAWRARVFVVGVDVQRQVLLPNGQFSEWEDVEPSRAMPRLEIPTPVIDERTGELLNARALEEALTIVRANQPLLMQPPFYPVDAGDEWKIPPLPGHEEATTTSAEPEKPDPRAEIRRKLREAQERERRKDWDGAEKLATEVRDDPRATPADKQAAEQILERIKKKRPSQEPTTPPPGRPPRPPRPEPTPTPGPGEAPTTKPAEPPTGEADLVVDPASADRDPAVWFHDDTVEPGKTYRYRMRVKIWNRYVGRRTALRNPEYASQTVLVGDWSLPSDPIIVAPKTHFFVRDQKSVDPPVATLDVFTWFGGRWHRESFDVRVGDTIGEVREVRLSEPDADGKPRRVPIDFSTGAVVLDLQTDVSLFTRKPVGDAGFTYSEQKSVALVYLDPADGQVKERINWMDRSSPLYKRLKSLASE